ncbi:GNAT family N-acetyltransferase [Candidatus Epulonipiscium viviparus]|uniref:GNAT family N-acetyltransferase n=1 Tax=Candidatus Epulonipiscium viviparus TaxID=420336 RepID=UPI0027381573|nr:GNAT family N-acetyltransferase [Candidatus Epulopiscium viviparus]
MDIRIDLTNTIIETDRLTLRFWTENDLEDFFEYATEEGVGEMAGWKHHSSAADTKKILDMFLRHKNDLAISYKEKVIGSIGLNSSWANIDETFGILKVKDLGYVLNKNYWNQGLMTEALQHVIPYCFAELKLDALTCGHFTFNQQSKRVIDKLKFEFVEETTFECLPLKQTFQYLRYIKIA